MPTSSYMPSVVVEIAFDSGYSTPTASRTWTDVSAYVELDQGISITYGRADEFTTTEPNHLSLTLDNRDGRFTAGKTDGAYYPNVKIGRPIRVTSTPVGGSASVRFLGYVEEWPVSWDGTDATAYAQITALSRMARLGLDAELRSIVSEQIMLSSPYAYYPLNEPAGATQAADAMGGLPLLASSGYGLSKPVAFGANTWLPGAPTETGLDIPAATNFDAQTLVNTITPILTAYPFTISVEAFVTDTAGGNGVPLNVGDATLSNALFFFFNSNTFNLGYRDTSVTLAFISGGVPKAGPVHLAGEMVRTSATALTLNLYVDGVLVATDSTVTTASPFDISVVQVTDTQSSSSAYSISHVTLARSATGVADRAAAGLTGFAGESAGARLTRLALMAGVLSTEVDGGTATQGIVPIDTIGVTALDTMRKVEAAEGGVLHDSRSNVLTLNSRVSRYKTTSAFTLSAASQEIEADIAPKLDRSTLVNDITATSFDGIATRVSNAASIANYGYARQTIDALLTKEDAASSAAWDVARYAEPSPRIPALGVDMLPLTPVSRQTALLAAHIGTRFTAAGLPAQAPASSIDFFIEGYSETIGPESYRFVFNVSPIDASIDSAWWILGDATYGAYDSNPIAF